MAFFEPPEMPKTPVSPQLLVGVASPLWSYFGAAAAGGVAFWWMTRWTRPVNLEALLGAAVTATPEARVEPEPVVVEVAEMVALSIEEPVAEPVVEAAPEPVVDEPAPVLEAAAEAVAEPVLDEAAAEEIIEAPRGLPTASEPEPEVAAAPEPPVEAAAEAEPESAAAPAPKPRSRKAAPGADKA
ncbi:MAG: hypothetical protein GC203_00635 [Phenylobacterium sp.]|uniref:hypothetical protein n=1 Tax=Phenylobacterium sp. TaxID=1871053 RepID=UPI0025E0EEB4|nr:hypothetical protein [Phenylobacterium sp.]MBI1196349.1 hypothetical protein [Phenylobacterium sp.]